MKKIILLYVLLLGITLSSLADEGYTIKGKINGNYTGYIYLSYQYVKDSTLVQNSSFEFTGKVDKPVQAWLNLKPDANIAWVYLENSVISIEGDFSTYLKDNKTINLYRITSITGSYSQNLLEKYQAFRAANKEKENYNALRFQELKRIFTNDSQQPVSGKILGDLINNYVLNHDELFELFSLLDTTAMQSDDLKLIKTGLRSLNKYGIGQAFVSFKLPNQNQESISLEKYSGKILLVDFWASWCSPCREKHPAMVELQKKYQEKNFTIVSISIDKDMNAWSKAILKDGLVWGNLIDPDRKISNELGIVAIPTSYLLDEQGNIISINQSIEKIDKLLREKL